MFLVEDLIRNDLVVTTGTWVYTHVDHASCLFNGDGARDALELDANWEFIDGDERHHFSSSADYEVFGPGCTFVGRV